MKPGPQVWTEGTAFPASLDLTEFRGPRVQMDVQVLMEETAETAFRDETAPTEPTVRTGFRDLKDHLGPKEPQAFLGHGAKGDYPVSRELLVFRASPHGQ